MTRLMKPLGPWVLAVLAWLWLVTTVVFRVPVLVLAGGWLALGAAWVYLLVGRRFPRPWAGDLGFGTAALAAVLGLLGFLQSSSRFGPDLAEQVAQSEPELLAYIGQLAPGSWEIRHEPRRVGVLVIDGTEELDGLVLLYIPAEKGRYDINRYGVAYNSSGRPMPGRTGITEHLYGPWYRFVWWF